MELLYVANNRMPTPRAHGIHIAKMCEAFSAAGANVTLALPRRRNSIKTDVFSYYGVARSFNIVKLPVIDLIGFVPFAFALETFSFAISLRWYLQTRKSPLVVFLRGEPELALIPGMPKRHHVVWESHIKVPRASRYRAMRKRARGIVVVTRQYRDELIAGGFPPEKILLAPDGVDFKAFALELSRTEARKELGLPQDKKIAVYCGSDISWKGLGTLKEAAHLLPAHYLVVFVGAIAPDKAAGEKSFFAGPRSYREIPLWLRAADVVVLTGTKHSEISTRYTSPLKLFEYMASGRPIVASDIPSFRDVLSTDTALFAEPDNPSALASAIVEAVENTAASARRVQAARAQAEHYSWGKRGAKILSFITERL
jgi:glycosyltransferase involved in cell wall biosynthesis